HLWWERGPTVAEGRGRAREGKNMGFSRSHNDELKSLERGRAAADTPMLIQDFGASLSMAIRNDALPMASQANKKRFGYKN
ncbi:MAG: hypothetical protein IKC51_05020, partial [Myxococcaceae bacterium]|nr:hypothetical protein [Myxococcaceae bacterium]